MMKLIKNQVALFAGMMLSISVSAQTAQPVCKTLDECQALLIQVDEQIKKLQVPSFLDAAKNAHGSVDYMTQSDAIQYCANQGARLPSARELAQLSMRFGAKGIVDTCGTDRNCYKVSDIKNLDNSKDEFYFSFSGYGRPDKDLSTKWFWSSSVSSIKPNIAIVLHGGDGDLIEYGNRIAQSGDEFSTDLSAVICVAGR